MYHIINAKGPAATPKEIASHYNVIMMAGAVTTATFLSGALYYLCRNRHALRRLQDEMRRTFPSIEAIISKDLMHCTYLNAVVEEGLRIYPPAGAAHLSRLVPRGGCEISGRFIPEYVRFFLPSSSILLLHIPPHAVVFAQKREPTLYLHLPRDPCIRPCLDHPSGSGQFPHT